MTARLAGKVALITGAGAGIARASALLFAAEGAKVAVCELNTENGEDTAKRIREAGGEACFIHTDVTDEASVRRAVVETTRRFGSLSVLFNCVGTAAEDDAPCTEVDMRLWQPTFDRNVLSVFLCCRHGIPALIDSGGGSVINMTSWVASRGIWHKHVYTAAKGAVVSLTRRWRELTENRGSALMLSRRASCGQNVRIRSMRIRNGTLPLIRHRARRCVGT